MTTRLRTDWRDTLGTATDLALVGVVVTVAALPLLTAGAAVHAGSVAVRAVVDGEAVSPAALWRAFRRSLLPGAAAVLACGVLGWLLLFDLSAVAAGRVPGGTSVLVGTGAAAAALLAVAGLGVVRLAQTHSWPRSLRWAMLAVWRQPFTAAAVAGVSAVAAVIALLMPVTAPLLVGYLLFAWHVLARRTLDRDG